jgi:hypothetical protein
MPVNQSEGKLFEDRIFRAADLVEGILESQSHIQHPLAQRRIV